LIFNEIGSREGRIKSTVSKVYKRTASSIRDAEMIAELAAHVNGKTILEMGTAFGTTSLAMHFAAHKSRIITLEGVPEIAAIAKGHFKKYEADNVILKTGRFSETLPLVVAGEKDLGLVFIDGHHSRKPTLEYLEMILPVLSDKAIVVLDDIYYSRDMIQCWSELQQHPAFQVKMDFFRFGLLIKNADLSAESFRLRLYN
jgi:predicted O-methyltransferase YrrM